MEIYLSELKHLKSDIEDIDNIEIILPSEMTDKIINKYYTVFENTNDSEDFIESLPDIICFTITRFYSKTVDYWITVITDEDGTGVELDISKELFYEILRRMKNYE